MRHFHDTLQTLQNVPDPTEDMCTPAFISGVSVPVTWAPEQSLMLPFLSLDDVNLNRSGSDLIVTNEEQGKLVLTGFFLTGQPEANVFLADGTLLAASELMQHVTSETPVETAYAENIFVHEESAYKDVGYIEFDLSDFAANAEYISGYMPENAWIEDIFMTSNPKMSDLLDFSTLSLDTLLPPDADSAQPVMLTTPTLTADYLHAVDGIVRQEDGFTEVELTRLFFSTIIV